MRHLYPLYQAAMACLALIIVWLITLPDEPWVRQANFAIWMVFLADYLLRLRFSPRRDRFIRRNVPDLIAILPLDYLLELLVAQDLFGIGRLCRLARFLRVVWLLRAGAVLWRVSHNMRAILGTNGLGYVLAVASGVVMLGGVSIWLFEPEIGSAGDGIWWSIVTTTTVGYGDISPRTTYGRMIAAILMIVGIGTIGMITGSITTYFLGRRKTSNTHITHIMAELERWDELTAGERIELAALLKAVADSSDPQPR